MGVTFRYKLVNTNYGELATFKENGLLLRYQTGDPTALDYTPHQELASSPKAAPTKGKTSTVRRTSALCGVKSTSEKRA
jgi:hypothetical protein